MSTGIKLLLHAYGYNLHLDAAAAKENILNLISNYSCFNYTQENAITCSENTVDITVYAIFKAKVDYNLFLSDLKDDYPYGKWDNDVDISLMVEEFTYSIENFTKKVK